MHQTEREGEARTQRATQESEKTTDSEHIGPPECQSSLSRRQFRVKQFFFPALFWTNGYIFQQTNKRKEVTDSTQRDTHTQAHSNIGE